MTTEPEPQQPQDPQPPQPSFELRRFLTAIIALAVIITGIVVVSLRHRSSTPGNGSAATTGELHQPVRDGPLEFVVLRVTCGTPNWAQLGRPERGQFCLADVSVTNSGATAHSFDGSDEQALAGNGATYDDDDAAELVANKDDETFLKPIVPGHTVARTLVFDIPKDASIKQLRLRSSSFSPGVSVNVT